MPLLDDEETAPSAPAATRAAPKPAPAARTPAPQTPAPRTPAPRTPATKQRAYTEPPQSFPDEEELGTSEQETYSPEMAVLLGERESRSPLTQGGLAAAQERIARVKELRSKTTPAGVPTWMPSGFKQDQSMSYAEQAKAQGFTQDKSGQWTKAPDRVEQTLETLSRYVPALAMTRSVVTPLKPQPRVGSVPGAYGGTTATGTGATYPTSAELASPVEFRDAATRYTAAYRAAQQAAADAVSNQERYTQRFMAGRTMDPSDPSYDAREVAAAREKARRLVEVDTLKKSRDLASARATLSQYGYTEDEINAL
jgi:hypothetical protein